MRGIFVQIVLNVKQELSFFVLARIGIIVGSSLSWDQGQSSFNIHLLISWLEAAGCNYALIL